MSFTLSSILRDLVKFRSLRRQKGRGDSVVQRVLLKDLLRDECLQACNLFLFFILQIAGLHKLSF